MATEEQLTTWKARITELKEQCTGNMMADINMLDEIHNLEMKINGVKPEDGQIDCIGCGS